MNNISKKLLAYSLLSVVLTGCNKEQDQVKEKSPQTFKEVLTNDDIDQKMLEKISEFFNNNENSYETFIQIVNMSEDKLSLMHEKIHDAKIKKFINFVTMIKLTALFSEVSKINEEIKKESTDEEINANIENAAESSTKSVDVDEEEDEENIYNEIVPNEEIKEDVKIESENDNFSEYEEDTDKDSNLHEDNELLIESNYDEEHNSNNYDNTETNAEEEEEEEEEEEF